MSASPKRSRSLRPHPAIYRCSEEPVDVFARVRLLDLSLAMGCGGSARSTESDAGREAGAAFNGANLTNANLLGATSFSAPTNATYGHTTCPNGTVTDTGC